jgi:hypothetical protein
MDAFLSTLAGNLISPPILFFALGLAAGLLRSDLEVPEAIAKGLAVYLMLAIGFKGGVAASAHGFDANLLLALAAAAALSFALPLPAFGLLRALTRLGRVDRAAVAAHYGSISLVTFVTAAEFLTERGIGYEGYLVAMAALMEAPAILTGLWLAGSAGQGAPAGIGRHLWREVLLNGSVVLLAGAFLIGVATGKEGLDAISPFVVAPFTGALCLFLLDMGLLAGRQLRGTVGRIGAGTVAFGFVMPCLGALAGLGTGLLLSLSEGGLALLITLAASASYIAVPAAMRLALPRADTSVSITLSLAVTFPLNIAVGIPVYAAVAAHFASV